jgi:hypothetical protein
MPPDSSAPVVDAQLVSPDASADASLPDASLPDATPDGPNIYIIAGQSNAVGGAKIADLPDPDLAEPFPEVPFAQTLNCPDDGVSPCLTDQGWGVLEPRQQSATSWVHGVELSLGRALYAAGAEPWILKVATNGSGLAADWHPDAHNGARLYPRFLDSVAQRVAEAGPNARIRAIIWIQGNHDGNWPAEANSYRANLRHLVDAFRTDLGTPDVPVVLDRLHPAIAVAYNADIRWAQDNVGLLASSVVVIDVDDLTLRDTDHYDSASMVALGERFAAALTGP